MYNSHIFHIPMSGRNNRSLVDKILQYLGKSVDIVFTSTFK